MFSNKKSFNKKINEGKNNCYPIRKKVLGHFKLRNLVTIGCLVGCFTQFFELTEDYLSFQTRLFTEVKRNYESFTEKPAITVCIDKVFNYTKLEEVFPDFRQEILKYNGSRLYIHPILQFPNVYKFLNQKIPNLKARKSIDYSVDLAQLINCSLDEDKCALNAFNQIFSYNIEKYCLTTFSLNTSDPPFHQGTISPQAYLYLDISQMTSTTFYSIFYFKFLSNQRQYKHNVQHVCGDSRA